VTARKSRIGIYLCLYQNIDSQPSQAEISREVTILLLRRCTRRRGHFLIWQGCSTPWEICCGYWRNIYPGQNPDRKIR